MSTEIGSVNVNLRLSLAQFKQDVQDGTNAARAGTKAMADDVKVNSFEARGTLMLLGEEIGVHIPRHLQRMIADLPGVGSALQAAFSSVAVLAMIEILVKVVEKVQKWREEATKTAAEWTKLGIETQKSSDAIRVANDQLEISIAKLTGLPTGGLQLKRILDEVRASADELADALTKDGQKMDELLKKNSVGVFAKIFENQEGISDVQDAITKLHEGVKDVANEEARQLSITTSTAEAEKIRAEAASKIKDIYAQTNTQLQGMLATSVSIQKQNEETANLPITTNGMAPIMQRSGMDDQTDRIKALGTVLTQLGRDSEDTAGKETHLGLALKENVVKNADEARKALEAAQRATEGLRNSVDSLMQKFQTDTSEPFQKTEREADAAEEQIRKMAADNPKLFAAAFPHQNVDDVALAMRHLATQVEDKQFQAGLEEIGKKLAAMPKKLPDFGPVTPVMPVLAADAHTNSTAEDELAKISTSSKAANDEARKVIDSIQTENTKFKEQVAILDELKSKGLLTGQEYAAAFKKAEDASEKVTGEWKKLGNQIGGTISQALDFQKSWQQALKEILADILKVIVQMELMKALGKSGASSGGGGGGGGFLGILGSLFGGAKAAGGPVDNSHAYLVGEHGPEIFAPKGHGTIIPNMKEYAGGQTTYQHIQNITTPDADSFNKSAAQIASDAYENMASAHSRNR
jgi:hypothetical protein